MASRIFHDLLLQSHQNLSRFRRQAYWILVGALVVHWMILTPFLGAWHHSQQTVAEAQRLADIGPGLDAAIEDLDDLRKDYLAILQPAFDEQVRGLELDLARLEASRWQWQQEASEDGEESEPPGPTLDRSLVMSTAPRGVVPFPIQETLLPELRQAQNRYALLTLLEPLVEEQIVRPKMQALQRTWDVDTLPVLNAELHAIGDKVSTWRARLPEARDGWDAVSVALSAMAEGAAAWTAQPPSQPFWWASPESESRLVLGLGSHREALSQPPSLAHLAVQQQELRNHLAEVAGTWQRRWQDIPLESSSSSGWSASWFSKAMPWVPAALGLLLVTLVWGHTSASRQLIAAVDRAIAYGSPPALADWCGAQISSRYTPSNPSPRLGRQFLVQTVAALLWMGMVAHQTLGQPDADWTPWVPTAIAAGLLLAVAGYRFFSLKQGLRHFETDLQADDDSNSPAVASLNDAPEHAEENPVEISLRR